MLLIWSYNKYGTFENSFGQYLHLKDFVLILLLGRKYVTAVSLGEVVLSYKKAFSSSIFGGVML